MNQYLFVLVAALLNLIWVFPMQNVFACVTCKQVKVDIQLGIINGYSGTLLFVDQYYFDGSQYYTSQSTVDLSLGATESSTYTVFANDTSIQSGTGVGEYITTLGTPLIGPDGLFEFQASFINSENERVESNTLVIQKDTTSPAVVDQINVQIAETGGNTGIIISRDPSSDSGAGLAGYQIVFASDSSFINTVTFSTISGPLIIDSNLIPANFDTIQIIAIDNVGNTSHSIPVYFSGGTGSNRGNGGSTTPNNFSITNAVVPEDKSLIQGSPQENQEQISNNIDPETISPILIFQDIDDINTKSPNEQENISDVLVVQASPLPQGNKIQNFYDWSWISNVGDTTTQKPQSGVRGVGSSPYNQIFICSDEQCVEVSNSGEMCGEVLGQLSCIDIQPQLLHSVANSQQEAYYAALIAYHKELSRRIKYMIIIIYYSLCYDIEIHLRRMYLLKKEK